MGSYSFKAAIFDLDGVITKTAVTHFRAWKLVFDQYLRLREKRNGETFREFTHEGGYLPYVDGKPRYAGVKDFLESRGIKLDYGEPGDPPETETICGIGNRKNKKFLDVVSEEGVEVYPSTVALIKELKKQEIRIGVVSSSKNCREILAAAEIQDLFETRVDGVSLAELGLKGKPEGDMFVKAADNLGVSPAESAIFEDALAGVAAGRNGCFGLVVGIARESSRYDLLKGGADLAVKDLAEISPKGIAEWFSRTPLPLFEFWSAAPEELSVFRESIDPAKSGPLINPHYLRSAKSSFLGGRKPVFFFDYDGTLTPIVDRPELALMPEETKRVLKKLIKRFTVSVISGRLREDVESLVGIEGIFYAGSHGFDIRGPQTSLILPEAQKAVPLIEEKTRELKNNLGKIKGILIEEKKFSTAVHYRLADEKYLPEINACLEAVVKDDSSLRLIEGKKVFEVLPAVDWNKGRAVRWIMQALGLSWEGFSVVYVGDDTTDEDAFRVLRTRGTAVLVSRNKRISAADFYVSSPSAVIKVLELLV